MNQFIYPLVTLYYTNKFINYIITKNNNANIEIRIWVLRRDEVLIPIRLLSLPKIIDK